MSGDPRYELFPAASALGARQSEEETFTALSELVPLPSEERGALPSHVHAKARGKLWKITMEEIGGPCCLECGRSAESLSTRIPSCGVCEKNTLQVYHSAGGTCRICISCRQFFRNTVLRGLLTRYVCLGNNECLPMNCKLCKFGACLRIGMQPERVGERLRYNKNL